MKTKLRPLHHYSRNNTTRSLRRRFTGARSQDESELKESSVGRSVLFLYDIFHVFLTRNDSIFPSELTWTWQVSLYTRSTLRSNMYWCSTDLLRLLSLESLSCTTWSEPSEPIGPNIRANHLPSSLTSGQPGLTSSGLRKSLRDPRPPIMPCTAPLTMCKCERRLRSLFSLRK